MLPTVSGTCPTITKGASAVTLTFAGEPVEVWTGSPTGDNGGPLVMYWYPTGGSASSLITFDEFGQTNIDAVTAAGGMVASFGASNGQGTDTGDGVWFTGDFDTADQVVACAIQQLHNDTTRIFITGASAGALETSWMSYARSGYVAAAVTLSGGIETFGGFSGTPTTLQDPTNVPSIMAVHGAEGMDVVGIDFAVASAAWEADIASKHGFSMDCNTGGGHVSGPPQILPGMWQFMVDHPFKVSPQPYPPIPTVYPSYCVIGPRGADGGAP
jgi:poly(3-hydroxybutyrate) depolymerase